MYEDGPDKTSTNETNLQPLTLQVKNEQDEKITDLIYKLPTYEDRLYKMIINETQLHPLALQVKN